MSDPARWALSPSDFRAHAVTDPGEVGMYVAQCRHTMPRAAGLDDAPRGSVCAACVRAVAPDLSIADRIALIGARRDADGVGPAEVDEGLLRVVPRREVIR